MKLALQILAFVAVLFFAVCFVNFLFDKKKEYKAQEQQRQIEMTSIYKLKRIYVQPAHWWAK